MGHLVFLVLHVAALMFGMAFLMLTIPLHLIYSLVATRSPARSDEDDGAHVRCPECRELVRADASKCKHCGSTLKPVPVNDGKADAASALNLALGIGAVVGIVLLAKACGG
jgi:hypothetical protein